MRKLDHRYGNRVNILNDALLNSWLTELCSPETFQPKINSLVEKLYGALVREVISNEFPTSVIQTPTRMTAAHPDIQLKSEIIDPKIRAVCVNLARAGTWPSHVCYDVLNHVLRPEMVRQDHILAARLTDSADKVTGTSLSGAKIGGDIDQAVVLIPDPMGATGSTIVSTVSHYKQSVGGTPRKLLALHLIVTPEYLKTVTRAHPDLVVYALRLDRGLSKPDVLQTTPGTRWDEERGLNDKQYIVPGGGGFGEIMNNSFV